jgi:hypothetical protein
VAIVSATDELFALLEQIGATPTLYGKPVTVRELKTFAWASFVERFTDIIVTEALRASILPAEPQWSPYPVGVG